MDKEAQRGVEKEPLLANYCKLFHRKREKKRIRDQELKGSGSLLWGPRRRTNW